jgi:hypothetical protein
MGVTPSPRHPGEKTEMKKRAKKLVKTDTGKIDGLSAKDVEKIRRAIRQVWSWSYPRGLVVKRCLVAGGFSKCEKCKKKCPKIFVDHIKRVGDVDAGFIHRLFVPSKYMQGLCKECHKAKTNEERKAAKAVSKLDSKDDTGDFF